jgi:hypothetical protein
MLIRMWRHGAADEFVNLPDLRDGHGSMDTTMTKYWDLIVEMAERREDGGRAGWWRLTGLGERYVLGEATVPQYVRVFDDRRLSYLGPALSIHVALGKKFDYAELMSL